MYGCRVFLGLPAVPNHRLNPQPRCPVVRHRTPPPQSTPPPGAHRGGAKGCHTPHRRREGVGIWLQSSTPPAPPPLHKHPPAARTEGVLRAVTRHRRGACTREGEGIWLRIVLGTPCPSLPPAGPRGPPHRRPLPGQPPRRLLGGPSAHVQSISPRFTVFRVVPPIFLGRRTKIQATQKYCETVCDVCNGWRRGLAARVSGFDNKTNSCLKWNIYFTSNLFFFKISFLF